MKQLKFFQAGLYASVKTNRSLLCGVRNMQDPGAQIIDPDNPLQHVASNVPPTIIGSASSTVKHHFQEITQSIENLTRCTVREISEEKATRQRSAGEPARGATPSVYFPADEVDTDFAWKCDHAVGTRWIRIHRLWRKKTDSIDSDSSADLPEGKTSSIEEHAIDISLPCLDSQFDENVQDPLAGNHHPFMLTIKDLERQVSLEFSMDIVNNEIILDSVVPRIHSDVAGGSHNQNSTTQSLGESKHLLSFQENVLQFQGPCLTESPFETEESLARPQSDKMIKMKNNVYTRLQSFLSERGLLNADESRANLLTHEKWSFWILQQIAYHEQCEYERWLVNLRDFVL
ncbi:p22 protein precursor [Perkinsela sp. CCAP 1560/4]|nr:p22 protein precursor [Perkinsela sp. CCAP 1560/4]|eukprot:KNH09533.1 p22 protein precursor [Perkinsela sp. CCAP 1560/4]